MPTLVLNWVPVNDSNSSGQRAKAIAKVNGTIPSITTGFSPANILAKQAFSTAYNAEHTNLIYRFTIENLCITGGPTGNNNGIKEQLQFECITTTVVAGDITGTTYTARIKKGQHLSVDNTSYPNGTSSITGVEYKLYNQANTTLIQGPVMATLTGTGADEAFTYTFTGLTPSTSYTVRSVLISQIDDTTTVRSDSNTYLGIPCVSTVTTTADGVYTVNNVKSGVAVSQPFEIYVDNTLIGSGNTDNSSGSNSISGTSSLIPTTNAGIILKISNNTPFTTDATLNGISANTTVGQNGTVLTLGWTNITATTLVFEIVGGPQGN